jgi:hypothetical protein
MIALISARAEDTIMSSAIFCFLVVLQSSGFAFNAVADYKNNTGVANF